MSIRINNKTDKVIENQLFVLMYSPQPSLLRKEGPRRFFPLLLLAREGGGG